METQTADRLSLAERLLADPPAVHSVHTADGVSAGLWATEDSCYRFIARAARPGMRTLETGSGLSTALFAALGTHHTCVTPDPVEAERLRRYFDEKQISGDRVTFVLEPSQVALPRLSEPLELLFIDGLHGFPLPIIDWFYGAALLVRGGTLIVDDINLPPVQALLDFLDCDSRWEKLERGKRWAAFRRGSEESLVEGHWQQPFYGVPFLARRVLARARREIRGRLGSS